MIPRDIIAATITGEDSQYQLADAILAALTAAGFRIVGPGEVDKETVERAAAWHDHNAEILENDDSPYSAWHKGAAAAIRALGRKA